MPPLSQASFTSKIDSERRVKVLFFGRNECEFTLKAINHLNRLEFEVTSVFSRERGEVLPEEIGSWIGHYIFCFRSLYILPKTLLDRAKIAAINFHPGSAEYPGSGCVNFALYENATQYGVTAHLMNEKVDDGEILECRRFPILEDDSVDSLLGRTHVKMLDLFFDITSGIGSGGDDYIKGLIKSANHEKWSDKNRCLKDLEKLSIVDLGVSEPELKRIIRATYTKLFPPKVMIHGYEFVLKPDNTTRKSNLR